jgi:hypothetical protein
MKSIFTPVEVGEAGRRAVAWFLDDGLVVSATDADAAAHAMVAVLEALSRSVGARHSSCLVGFAAQALERFPDFPDEACTEREHKFGRTDGDVNQLGVGYGYVCQAVHGHECGGALFNRVRHTVRLFETHTVWLRRGGMAS